MGKIWQFKNWLLLEAAAAHIGNLLDEDPVTEADLLHLAIENKLQLSAIFPDGALARTCNLVDPDKVDYNEVRSLDGKRTLKLPVGGAVFHSPRGHAFQTSEKLVQLPNDEPLDLAMVGGERQDVVRAFWSRSGRAVEDTENLDGTFVSIGPDASPTYLCLVGASTHSDGRRFHFPLGALPDQTVLVVRRSEIRRFLESLEGTSTIPPPLPSKWPWGHYQTQDLGHLEAAALRFWKNFDPSDRTTAPTNQEVSDWLVKRGVSRRTADTMATILRADGLPTGPRTS